MTPAAGLFERAKQVASLLADPRTPRLPRLAVLGAIAYLIMPFDLIPDFVFPVVGYLDDFGLLWLTLRWMLSRAPGTPPPGQ